MRERDEVGFSRVGERAAIWGRRGKIFLLKRARGTGRERREKDHGGP